MSKLFCLAVIALLPLRALAVPMAGVGQAEADKCEQEINALTSDILSKYATSLAGMLTAYQKAADLESALTVRSEISRLKSEQMLTEQSFVAEPKTLRELQAQTYGKIRDFSAQILQTHLPKLTELKKSLTVEGKLDEAVAIRELAGQLQDKFGATVRLNSGVPVPAETLLQDYAADKTRADKLYKGKRLTISGSVAGFQQDPADENNYYVYLTAKGNSSLVQCSFPKQNLNIKEEKQGLGNVVLSIAPKKAAAKPGSDTKVFKGMNMNVQGMCEGLDKWILITKCSLPGS